MSDAKTGVATSGPRVDGRDAPPHASEPSTKELIDEWRSLIYLGHPGVHQENEKRRCEIEEILTRRHPFRFTHLRMPDAAHGMTRLAPACGRSAIGCKIVDKIDVVVDGMVVRQVDCPSCIRSAALEFLATQPPLIRRFEEQVAKVGDLQRSIAELNAEIDSLRLAKRRLRDALNRQRTTALREAPLDELLAEVRRRDEAQA